MEFVEQGLRKRYHLIPRKVRHNVTHFLRPEGLWVLLGVQQPWPAWRHIAEHRSSTTRGSLLVRPLFLALARRGPGAAARDRSLAWTALYLFLILVVFHSRDPLPHAAGPVRDGRRGRRHGAALRAGVAAAGAGRGARRRGSP